jgi:hypothetical protein
MNVETIKVKREGGKGYRLINKTDFDPKKHKTFDGEKVEAAMSAEERKLADEMEMRRKIEANRGQSGSVVDADVSQRNPSGTYSEPTPTDIRYPDKTATEFENNLGAFVGKSAAGLRQEMGLPDAPGGIHPHRRVAKGPKGLWFVMEGEDRVSAGFKSEAEAMAELEKQGPAPDAA